MGIRNYFEYISDIISNLSNDVIIVGYFKLVLEQSKDYFNYLHINNPKARQVVLEQMNTRNLNKHGGNLTPKTDTFNFNLVSNSLICNVKTVIS